jgi:uncharacterized protein
LISASSFLIAAFAAAQIAVPPLKGRVNDLTGTLSAQQRQALEQTLAEFEGRKGAQIAVLLVPTTKPEPVQMFAVRVQEAWKLGRKGVDDGVLLAIAKDDRELHIEVGYGLEGVLTDGLSSLIINQTIVPRFKAGDIAGGIEAGADAIIHQLTLPPEEAQKVAAEAAARPESGGGFPIFFLIPFLLFFVLPMLRAFRGGRGYRRSGLPGVVLWPGGFGGGGWSGGGGGFSGGGGSFGGGGSSGSW